MRAEMEMRLTKKVEINCVTMMVMENEQQQLNWGSIEVQFHSDYRSKVDLVTHFFESAGRASRYEYRLRIRLAKEWTKT